MKSLLCLLSLCLLPLLAQEPAPREMPEGVDEEFLVQCLRHLYRWVLDEDDAENIVGEEAFPFWVRELTPKLDEGDNSRMIQVVLPRIKVAFSARKADYQVPELKLHVKNADFRIRNVQRLQNVPEEPNGYAVMSLSFAEMVQRGERQMTQELFAEGEFLEKIRASARKEFRRYAERKNLEIPEGDQQVFLAPLSPVANETWVFWETGDMLLRISSDMDLQDPDVWRHEDLAVELFDIREQTVVSLKEVPGSNAYMTRDQVGRYLFNCVILGKRLVLAPPAEVGQP